MDEKAAETKDAVAEVTSEIVSEEMAEKVTEEMAKIEMVTVKDKFVQFCAILASKIATTRELGSSLPFLDPIGSLVSTLIKIKMFFKASLT